MKINKAYATWNGNLMDGSGQMKLDKSNLEFPFSFKSRFENGEGSNPELLIGAAHAGCFSMAFSNMLAQAGFEPKEVVTTAAITLDTVDGGAKITQSKLIVEAIVPGIDEKKFQEIAAEAKVGCPVSQALSAIEITLEATLKS